MAQQNARSKPAAPAYADNFEHLADELKKLDLLIQLLVTTWRSQTQALQQLAANRHVYISHEEVDLLLGDERALDSASPDLDGMQRRLELLQNKIQARVAASFERGVCFWGCPVSQTLAYRLLKSKWWSFVWLLNCSANTIGSTPTSRRILRARSRASISS